MLKRYGSRADADAPLTALGGRIVLPQWAKKLYERLMDKQAPEGEPPRWWGNVPLDLSLDELFFLIAGATGSGKSSVLRGLLATVVPTITPGSDRRLLVADPKNTMLPALYGMGPNVPVKVLTASDIRSHRIPLGRVVTSLARAKQLAKDLIPIDQGENSPFFPRAVRRLASGVMESLLTTVGTRWELRDLLLILESEHYLRQVLGRIPQTESRLRYLARKDLWDDIQATIEDKMDELKILAAWWHRAKGEFVPSDWLKEESILYIGGDPLIEEVMATIRRLIMKVLSEEILSLPPSSSRRIHLCIDEFQAFGGDDQPVPGAHKLATEGRDRGAVLIVTFQHINDLLALYRERAMSFIGQFGNVALLKANDHEMAEWESKMLSGYRKLEWKVSYSHSSSSSGSSWSTSHTPEIVERMIVPAGRFSEMEKASARGGIQGYFRSSAIGTWSPRIGPEFVAEFLPKPHPFIAGYDPRPASHQYLAPFDAGDFARLGLRPEEPEVKEQRERQIDRIRANLARRKQGGK